MTTPQRELADYCEWWPEDTSFVLVRPSGETLRFTCAEQAPSVGEPGPGPLFRARTR
jgi:hypothetical protein